MEHVGFVKVGHHQVVVDLIIEWFESTPSPLVLTELSSRMIRCMVNDTVGQYENFSSGIRYDKNTTVCWYTGECYMRS